MQTVSNNPINQKMAIVMAGIAKIFAGEIIESAKTIMDEWGEQGPLKQRHIREAYRKLKQNGKIPYAKEKQLFMK
jgi:transcription initiation factor TFIID subunit 11